MDNSNKFKNFGQVNSRVGPKHCSFSQISEVGVGSEHPKVDFLAFISGSQGTFHWWQFFFKKCSKFSSNSSKMAKYFWGQPKSGDISSLF
jgi:hypothetical protein